jgi:hypothetical protein
MQNNTLPEINTLTKYHKIPEMWEFWCSDQFLRLPDTRLDFKHQIQSWKEEEEDKTKCRWQAGLLEPFAVHTHHIGTSIIILETNIKI